LFRGAAEGHIRKYLIEDRNYLDAVIGLPANIFYGTSIPTCIMVLKKERTNKDNILFIDASQHFEKVKTQNYLREEDINLIIDTYTNRTATDKYSYVAKLQEVAENDYNLNIPRYVDTFEEEEPVDLSEVSRQLKEVAERSRSTDATIADYCNQLGIDTPF
jgi:type I restriction enzyme M protein